MDMTDEIVQCLRYEFRGVEEIIHRYDLDLDDYTDGNDGDTDAIELDFIDAMEDSIKEDYDLQDSIRNSVTEVIYGDADNVISNMEYIRDCDYDNEYLGEAFRNEEWSVLESIVKEGMFFEEWDDGVQNYVDDMKDDIAEYVQSSIENVDTEIESEEEDYDEGFNDIEESLKKKGWR